MRRTVSSMAVGENTRHRVRVESDECPPGTPLARVLQYRLLAHLAEVPDLLACGTTSFERLTMVHDGVRWVVEAEAVVGADGGVLTSG